MALSASQKGQIIEQLVAATCLLQSEGMLRVSRPLVDDEGVDLVITHRTTDRSVLLQIKSRFTLSKKGSYRANVRRVALRASNNRCLLFVYYDAKKAALGERLWFIPTMDFARLLKGQREARPRYVFQSKFDSLGDMWRPYQIHLKDVGKTMLCHLENKL